MMFGMFFSYSVLGLPYFYGLFGFVQFPSLVWNIVTVCIRFLLLLEVVSKLVVFVCVRETKFFMFLTRGMLIILLFQ